MYKEQAAEQMIGSSSLIPPKPFQKDTFASIQKKVSTRLGQGYFRDELIKYWKGCAVTGLKNPALLRASHIKPWAASTNQERLDPYNGLLLTPNMDTLFDKGYISFGSTGEVILSKRLSKSEIEKMGIHANARIAIEERHEAFLSYHRRIVFKEWVHRVNLRSTYSLSDALFRTSH